MPKNYIFCSPFNLKKYGKINGIQRYKCLDCNHNFVASKRLNSEGIWFKYTSQKQTIQQLTFEYQCSEQTIRRHLEKATKAEQKSLPQIVNIVMDTTHFKQRFAVLLLMDSLSLKPIYFRFFPAEKNQYYFDAISALIEKGIKIQSITCDGSFHLTKSPKSEAGKELISLYYSLKFQTQETLTLAISVS